MRQWIADLIGSDGEVPRAYLVKFSEDNEVRGWQHADFSGVLDILGDVAWDNAYGEGVTTLDVFVLTETGAMPCRVTQTALPELGTVCVEVTYRDPLKRGKAAITQADKGFRKTVEA